MDLPGMLGNLVEHFVRVKPISLGCRPRLCLKTERKPIQCAFLRELTAETIYKHAILTYLRIGHLGGNSIALPVLFRTNHSRLPPQQWVADDSLIQA